jgi:hypothetical protein
VRLSSILLRRGSFELFTFSFLVAISAFYVSFLYYYFAWAAQLKDMPQAYCVKCKTSIEIKNPQNVTLKNGKPAIKGVCPNCGTSVFRIGKA